MEQAQHPSALQAKKGEQWKRYLIDGLLAILVVVPITLIIFALPIHPDISTILLVYLFIVLWLAHQRGFWVVVLAALTACVAIDYFSFNHVFLSLSRILARGLLFSSFCCLLFCWALCTPNRRKENNRNMMRTFSIKRGYANKPKKLPAMTTKRTPFIMLYKLPEIKMT